MGTGNEMLHCDMVRLVFNDTSTYVDVSGLGAYDRLEVITLYFHFVESYTKHMHIAFKLKFVQLNLSGYASRSHLACD